MSDLVIIAILFVLSILIILFFMRKWIVDAQNQNRPSDELVAWLKDVGVRIESANSNIDQKLTANMLDFNKRLDKAAEVIGAVQKNIGEFSEIGRGMKEIQDFLQSPKLRGNIGEQILHDLLMQFLPAPSYHMQYAFKNGEKVDAVIKTSNGLIPIDAKFPMENYRKMMKEETVEGRKLIMKDFEKDVKKHIFDISKKYILVAEGTLDYAIMYVPSESVYYEIVRSQVLYDHASEKRVLIVSPMSFYAYLKAILMSFEGQKIEARAKEVVQLLQSMQKDYEKADEALSILNRHVTNAYNQISNVSKLFLSFGQKLDSTKQLPS